jgi:hypothetical protein
MSQLATKIKLYAKANGVDTVDFTQDVILLKQPGKDVVIDSWNLSIDEPTAEQIASYDSAGDTAETAAAVLYTRASEYKELKEQLDLLYHDMTADKGDKSGEWYKHIKKVKDDNPKE